MRKLLTLVSYSKKILTVYTVCFLIVELLMPYVALAAFSCTVSATCNNPDVVIMRISGTDNAHAELASQSNYSNLVCCSGITGLGNSCSGNFETVAKLSATTNAHVEENTQSNYSESACLSSGADDNVVVAYQASNCTGYDTTIASISGTTNAHVGNASAYNTKICGTVTVLSLTFSISDALIGFGSLSSSAARYATGDTSGSSSEVEAHTISVSTNASGGYALTLNGVTLRDLPNTITPIGSTNTASSPGTEQFGVRLVASGGSGTVTAPYAASGFALDTGSFPDQVASAATGDGDTTTYSVRYIANISSVTEPGTYSAALRYIATGTF